MKPLLFNSLSGLTLLLLLTLSDPKAKADLPMPEQKTELKSWERPHYARGGGDAFLFYVVYGRIDVAAPVSRPKYRTNGIPQGLDVMSYGRGSHPEVPHSFLEGYLWEKLQSTDPNFAKTIAVQDSCLILRGDFHDPANLDYLRDTVGLITHLLDSGGVAVYDPQMFVWWTPDKWRQHIFNPGGPVPRHHVFIFVSQDDDGTEWLHTRGMRKFGRPDLSIPHVTPAQKNACVDLCNRFIELQAFGGIIPEGQPIRMPSLPEGLICHHAGSLDDFDFNNVHIRIARK